MATHPNDCSCNHLDGPGQASKQRSLLVALVLLMGFALAEFGAGLYSHSVALRIEAGHMLSDAIALGIALGGTWMTARGWRRAEPMAAVVNSTLLLGVAGWLAWESVEHLLGTPEAILSTPMLLTAAAGVCVNGVNVTLLHPHSHQDLNLQGAVLHMLADVASAVGVLVAALVIWQTGWYRIDGLIGVAIAGLIMAATLPLLRRSLTALKTDADSNEPSRISLSVPETLAMLDQAER
ncbi:MAG: cation diffusion facilitator family transporter [Cyanobacteria bacterium P01_A01_bin.135]